MSNETVLTPNPGARSCRFFVFREKRLLMGQNMRQNCFTYLMFSLSQAHTLDFPLILYATKRQDCQIQGPG